MAVQRQRSLEIRRSLSEVSLVEHSHIPSGIDVLAFACRTQEVKQEASIYNSNYMFPLPQENKRKRNEGPLPRENKRKRNEGPSV
jgi:hypothetical protein